MNFDELRPGSAERTVAWQNTCGITGKTTGEKLHMIRMFFEEVEELRNALTELTGDAEFRSAEGYSEERLDALTETLDGIGDVAFTLQSLCELGLNTSFDALVHEVQRSNESKICKTLHEAEETVALYAEGKHPDKPGEKIDVRIEKVGDYWVLRRVPDNKVLKSKNYVRPRFNI